MIHPDITDLIAFGTAIISTGKLALQWLEKRGTVAKVRAITADGKVTPQEAEELRAVLLADTIDAALDLVKRKRSNHG